MLRSEVSSIEKYDAPRRMVFFDLSAQLWTRLGRPGGEEAIFELLPASASNGRKLAWSERFDVIHMPRNARFDCAAKIDRPRRAGSERFAEKRPATSKTLFAPTELN